MVVLLLLNVGVAALSDGCLLISSLQFESFVGP